MWSALFFASLHTICHQLIGLYTILFFTSQSNLLVMNPTEVLPMRITRLEICMYMHENSFDFTDQTNQEIAVHHFILEKHEILIEEITEEASKKNLAVVSAVESGVALPIQNSEK